MTSEQISKIYLVSESAAKNKINYVQRNTIYRQTKQTSSIVFSILNRSGALSRNSIDAYNDKVLYDYIEKWLEPDYFFK